MDEAEEARNGSYVVALMMDDDLEGLGELAAAFPLFQQHSMHTSLTVIRKSVKPHRDDYWARSLEEYIRSVGNQMIR